MESLKAVSEVIQPEIEDNVINFDMIKEAIIAGYHKGEAGRLQRLEPIKYDSVNILRLEFQNILRMDHLWVTPNLTKLSLNFNKLDRIENIEMLTSLKELDLSYNYIDKIENLENLRSLEILSLFNNIIEKIENLDALENLIILSLGNNKITTHEGIEQFRFMKKLYCLNLEGNPIAKDKENSLRIFIAAFLPNLKYYEYAYIKDNERDEGKTKYVRELGELQEAERDEIELKEKRAKALADEMRLSSSFVEDLNEHQLFESLFEGDKHGNALRMIGSNAEDLIRQYRNDFYLITQVIYKFGLVKYEERRKELEMFQECIEKGKIKSQQAGQIDVQKFLELKDEILDKTKPILNKIEQFKFQNLEDQSPEITESVKEVRKLLSIFNNRIDELWKILMQSEIDLFESIEETRQKFAENIRTMMNSFFKEVRSYFVDLNDISMNFASSLSVAVIDYIAAISVSGDGSRIPDELKDCLHDRNVISDLVDHMHEYHLDKIYEREDKLIFRGKTWIKDLLNEIQKNEITRNRSKIMNINYFLDEMRDIFDQLQSKVQDE